MRFTWKGRWRGGEIVVEAETLEELESILHKLLSLRDDKTSQTGEDFPTLPSGLGYSDTVRALLQTEWGRLSPRSMAEINAALEANTLHLTKGTLSGTLTLMTKRGELQRRKKNGKWVYTINLGT